MKTRINLKKTAACLVLLSPLWVVFAVTYIESGSLLSSITFILTFITGLAFVVGQYLLVAAYFILPMLAFGYLCGWHKPN